MSAKVQIDAVRESYDRLAVDYETEFSTGLIVGLRRRVVWRLLSRRFRPGQRVLDLGCGTGDDAIWLAGRGVKVHGIDASPAMLEIARYKAESTGLNFMVKFEERSIEALDLLNQGDFDGALSNFAAFNCVRYPEPAAAALGRLVRPGGWVAISLMSRHCLWETALWPLTAALRGGGDSIDPDSFAVYYHSVRRFTAAFDPWFTLEVDRGIGVTLPPADLDGFADRFPRALRALARADRKAGQWPLVRALADHRFLIFRRRLES